MLEIMDTSGCCAVREICNLSSEPNAKTAMKNWCEYELMDEDDSDYHYYPGEERYRQIPYAFYTFTGVIKHTDGRSRPPQNGRYGPEFARLIKRYKLGKLTQSVLRANRVNDPQHFVRIWTWAPSIKNCKKWYNKEFGNG